MHRRGFLKGLGVAGGSAAVAATAAWQVDDVVSNAARREELSSTVSPAAVRGRAQIWWSADTRARTVALTFDDGPTEQFTGAVLDLLDRHHVPATFFVIGELVERHPGLMSRLHAGGHEIENHSFDHISAAVANRDAVYSSMQRGADAIEKSTGTRPRWYRPPRGEITSATMLAAVRAHQDVALWSVVRDDGQLRDDDVPGVAKHLIKSLHPGAVIDLHDGIGRSSFSGMVDRSLMARRTAEIQALREVLPAWLDSGYQFTTLSRLIPPD